MYTYIFVYTYIHVHIYTYVHRLWPRPCLVSFSSIPSTIITSMVTGMVTLTVTITDTDEMPPPLFRPSLLLNHCRHVCLVGMRVTGMVMGMVMGMVTLTVTRRRSDVYIHMAKSDMHAHTQAYINVHTYTHIYDTHAG